MARHPSKGGAGERRGSSGGALVAGVSVFERLFRAWDTDGDGAISRSELARVIRFVTNTKIADEILDGLMHAADKNGDGVIGYDEFVQWISNFRMGQFGQDFEPSPISAVRCPGTRSALREWFNLMDMNQSGTLEYSEWAVSSFLLDEHAGPRAVEEEFDQLDTRGVGRVTFEDFLLLQGRLLDAIPRPLEEKRQLVSSRIAALAERLQQALESKCFRLVTGVEELLELMRQALVDASKELVDLDFCLGGDVEEVLVQLEEALDLPTGTRVDLRCFRLACHELELHDGPSITMGDLVAALRRWQDRGCTLRRASTAARRGSLLQGWELGAVGRRGSKDSTAGLPRGLEDGVANWQLLCDDGGAPRRRLFADGATQREGSKDSAASRQGSKVSSRDSLPAMPSAWAPSKVSSRDSLPAMPSAWAPSRSEVPTRGAQRKTVACAEDLFVVGSAPWQLPHVSSVSRDRGSPPEASAAPPRPSLPNRAFARNWLVGKVYGAQWTSRQPSKARLRTPLRTTATA